MTDYGIVQWTIGTIVSFHLLLHFCRLHPTPAMLSTSLALIVLFIEYHIYWHLSRLISCPFVSSKRWHFFFFLYDVRFPFHFLILQAYGYLPSYNRLQNITMALLGTHTVENYNHSTIGLNCYCCFTLSKLSN